MTEGGFERTRKNVPRGPVFLGLVSGGPVGARYSLLVPKRCAEAWFVQVARERKRPTYLLWAHSPVGAGPSSRRRPDPPWQPMRRTPAEPPEHRHP